MANPFRKLRIHTFAHACGKNLELLSTPRQEAFWYRADGNYALAEVHFEVIDALGRLWVGTCPVRVRMELQPPEVLAGRIDRLRRKRRGRPRKSEAADDSA